MKLVFARACLRLSFVVGMFVLAMEFTHYAFVDKPTVGLVLLCQSLLFAWSYYTLTRNER